MAIWRVEMQHLVLSVVTLSVVIWIGLMPVTTMDPPVPVAPPLPTAPPSPTVPPEPTAPPSPTVPPLPVAPPVPVPESVDAPASVPTGNAHAPSVVQEPPEQSLPFLQSGIQNAVLASK